MGRLLLEWLSEPSPLGRVHSVFARTINWTDASDRLLCLTSPRQGASPFAVVVDFPEGLTLDRLGVLAGDLVELSNQQLRLPGRAISISLDGGASCDSRVPRFERTPPFERWNAVERVFSALLRERDLCRTAWRTEGLGGDASLPEGLLPLHAALDAIVSGVESAHVFSNPFLERAASAAGLFARGAMLRDSELSLDGARGLIGLGVGLTPSGDDLLTGALALFHAVDDADPAFVSWREAVSRGIAAWAPGRTTRVARAYLDCAARGEFNENVLDVIRAIPDADEAELRRRARRLQLMGETSGSETLLGILLGVKIFQQTQTAQRRASCQKH
jgi:hypothetical protein